jgi:IS1 family transposase
VEGASIRSIERMTGAHRDTIMRLSVKVGQACERLLAKALRNLPCQRIQMDEIWCYVGKKQRHLKAGDDPRLVGDFWTFVAFDTDTELVAAYHVGKRDHVSTNDFVEDLPSRLGGKVELSADAMPAHVDAVKRSFGRKVDFGQIVKYYEAEPTGAGRYSPPKVARTETKTVIGHPVNVCTSHVERMNLNLRMNIRRFTRLTNAFSKKVENLRAAVALYLAVYNFVRVHGSLRVTPAMEAGITNSVWTIADLVELPEHT